MGSLETAHLGLIATQPADDCDEGQIGARLRLLRREQKLSIRELAAKCGISVNTLSLIENDRTSPSLNTLSRIARGLGVPVAEFFVEATSPASLIHQRQGQRPVLKFAHGTLENLGEGLPPLGAEPILVELAPGQTRADDISHAGREFIYCLKGRAACVVAGQTYPLLPGDSLLFDARLPHRWLNPHPEPARLLVLFCPMEAEDLPAERHLGR